MPSWRSQTRSVCQPSLNSSVCSSLQIFEADQTNLFEESTIFNSSLTYSLVCATTLLPCSYALEIPSIICKIGIQTLDLLQRYLNTQLTPSSLTGGGDPEDATNTTSMMKDSSLWLGGLTYHPVYYLRIYNSLIASAHLCQLYREERKVHFVGVGTNLAEEKAACEFLFTHLSTLITRAKQIMIQLKTSRDGDACSMIHPAIVALLVAICGPQFSPPQEVDASLCQIL
jgi:hypothetical protein